MELNEIHAVVGQLYLALVETTARNTQLNEMLRMTAEAQAQEPESDED